MTLAHPTTTIHLHNFPHFQLCSSFPAALILLISLTWGTQNLHSSHEGICAFGVLSMIMAISSWPSVAVCMFP